MGMKNVIAAVALSAASCLAWAQDLEFKGLRFGMTLEEVQEVHKGARCQRGSSPCEMFSIEDQLYQSGASVMTFGGVPATLLMGEMLAGRTQAFSARIKSAQFDAVAAAIATKYGPPTSRAKSAVTTRLGATFEQETLTWDRKDGAIIAKRYATSIDQSQVAVFSNDWVKNASSRATGAAIKGAADL